MYDDDTQKQVGAEAAKVNVAFVGAINLARLVARFRAELIIGGFGPEDASTLAADYFNAILDRPGEDE